MDAYIYYESLVYGMLIVNCQNDRLKLIYQRISQCQNRSKLRVCTLTVVLDLPLMMLDSVGLLLIHVRESVRSFYQ